MIERALRVGGTCTGEHGIGQGKRTKLVEEYGTDVVELMRVDQERMGSAGHPQPGQDLPVSDAHPSWDCARCARSRGA